MNIADLTRHERLPDAVSALVAAMSIFERDTSLHLVATSALASRIAARMELDPVQIENCRIGAMLHDVGMLGINNAIISQPSMLADPEWEILTEHSVLDPDALIGEEIPIEARIIAVADAFHMMTVPTPYRSAGATPAAIAELIGNAGSQFDESVVDAFGTSINYRRHLRRA
jgi:HD-GYP domain-containing protein (c-di-GMP phosphodiesterase class II)